MADPRPLAKPPIVEALLDIQSAIVAPESAYQSLVEELKDRYPAAEPRRGFQAQWKIDDGKFVAEPLQDLGFQGVVVHTPDRVLIAQFRPNGFTLNNLTTYVGGDELISEGLRLWQLFAEKVNPEVVPRVALRFINQIELPLHAGDNFEKYLTASAPTPKGAPQYLSEYLVRMVAHESLEAPDSVTITQELTSPNVGRSLVKIDIDAVRIADLPPDVGVLRPILDGLRALKNRAFFSLLTDEALNLFV